MKDICEVVSALNLKEIDEMLDSLHKNQDSLVKSMENLIESCGKLTLAQEKSDSGLLKMMLFERTHMFLDRALPFFIKIGERPMFLRSDNRVKVAKNLILHKIAVETLHNKELTNVVLLLKEILTARRDEDYFYTIYQQLDVLFGSVENLMNKIMNEKDELIEFNMFMRHFEHNSRNPSYLLYEVHQNLSNLLLK